MQLVEILWQHRNDFSGVLRCEFCGKHQIMKYGYDDYIFHNQVIPAIRCMACDRRSVEEIPKGISDPGYQGGYPVEKRQKVVEVWEEV